MPSHGIIRPSSLSRIGSFQSMRLQAFSCSAWSPVVLSLLDDFSDELREGQYTTASGMAL